MKKAVVILGAGASFDVHNGSVPVSNGEMRPPLARQLFEARFWRIRQEYPGAILLGAELGRLAANQSEPFDLEAKLSEYAESPDHRTRSAFKAIPPYLRDVLVACVKDYVPSPTNYLNMVRRLLQDQSHEIMFAVLNYDVLLEDALRIYDRALRINDMDGYVDSSRQARVIKVHGSTNWAIPIPGTGSWFDALDNFDPTTANTDSIILQNKDGRTYNWGEGRGHFYPYLTAPIRGKVFSARRATRRVSVSSWATATSS
jgi:hypothetical protein